MFRRACVAVAVFYTSATMNRLRRAKIAPLTDSAKASAASHPADFDGPMADKPFPPSPHHQPAPATPSLPGTPAGDARAPGSEPTAGVSAVRSTRHRSSDVRDAMAEMAERAQLISQEAGTKIAAAMKDVISAAAGMAGFAVESARDLVQYMVRRGQMTQDEADKLIREAEEAHGKKSGRTTTSKAVPERGSKSEPARDGARREAAKPTTAAAKRPSGAAAAAKPEKKGPVKGDAARKKPTAKHATPKKRR